MNDILADLNEKQREAVTAPDGPLLILAGAGSGKTKTLTHRVAYLIRERGVSPRSILTVTFTNKAAEEMKERVKKLLGDLDDLPTMGTFHSVCVRILRSDIHNLGRENSFTIVDANDQLSLVKSVMKDLSLDPKQINPRGVLGVIGRAKNALVSASEFQARADSHYEEVVGRIFAAYEKRLRQVNALDFDDLIAETVKLFQERPEVLKKYQQRFRHILIDEYQDTNYMQYRLINLLAAEHKNLFIIGDDYQSIYSFRAADISNILNFKKDYPQAKIITLEQNYRSTQTILDAASAVIAKNKNQHHKKLWTDKERGCPINLFAAGSERDEAMFVARRALALHRRGRTWRQMVVLYRTNAQSRNIEESFMREGIPYRMVGGTKFYDRKEIKDIIAYLRLTANGADEPALRRVVNVPARGIGEKTLQAWLAFAAVTNKDAITAGLLLDKEETVLEGLSAARRKAVAEFSRLIARARDLSAEMTLPQLIIHLYEQSGYRQMLSETEDNIQAQTREENIKELLTVAGKYRSNAGESLNDFLEKVALVADTDNIDRNEDAVHLMTLHSVKGLEFPVVFIVGAEEGLLPHSRSQSNAHEMEEERRLMYVGMTRAMEELYITYAKQRMIFGSLQNNARSRFLDDLPEDLCRSLKKEAPSSLLTDRSSSEDLHLSAQENLVFGDGETVRHPTFGVGMIVAQDKNSYTIAFASSGIKKIAKDFDDLKKE